LKVFTPYNSESPSLQNGDEGHFKSKDNERSPPLGLGYTGFTLKEHLWVIVTTVIILIVFSLPGKAASPLKSNTLLSLFLSDPMVHIYRFGTFALVLARDLSRSNRGSLPYYYIKVALITFAYGFFIEVYQIFLPHRGFEIRDLGWNGVGILSASGILWLFKSQRLKSTITSRNV